MPDGTQCLYALSTTGNITNSITDNAIITDNQTNWYFRARIHIASISGLTDGEMKRIVMFNGTRGGYNGITVTVDSGVYNLRMGYYNGAAAITSGYQFSIGETMDVEAHLQSSTGWEFRVNGVTISSGTGASVSGDFDEISIGSLLSASSISPYTSDLYAVAGIYVDCVDISTSGWLGTGCTATGNILSERFEATEYDNSWIENLASGGTLNGDSTGP